jgi:hypothetical protein
MRMCHNGEHVEVRSPEERGSEFPDDAWDKFWAECNCDATDCIASEITSFLRFTSECLGKNGQEPGNLCRTSRVGEMFGNVDDSNSDWDSNRVLILVPTLEVIE